MANHSLKLNLRELTLFAMLGAITFAGKAVMMALPNIEPVSLMTMLFAVVFGRKCLYPIYVYVVLEFILYGFHLWSINYLYVWAVLAGVAWLMRKMTHPLSWALLSGCFGLFFGVLCAPVYSITGGFGFALSWWVSGIPYDLLHCAGNFVIALILFVPLRRLLEQFYAKIIN